MSGSVEFHPLVPERWLDLEKLFGKHGAVGGGWCMWWKQMRAEFSRLHGEPNRLAFKAIVDSNDFYEEKVAPDSRELVLEIQHRAAEQ